MESSAVSSSKSTKRREHKKGKKRSRRSSNSSDSSLDSSSSSSDDSSSSSSSSEEEKRRKKRKKKSKSSDRKSKEKKKKKKKKRKKEERKGKTSKTAIDQNEYGKYGILRESDFHAKQQSFEVWMREVKQVSNFNGPKWEAMEMFKEYMEDYNTATMSHEKYYDVEKWEMTEARRKQTKSMKKQRHLVSTSLEKQHRQQLIEEKERAEQKDFQLIMQTMDREKIKAMREQDALRTQMQIHYRSGNVEEARKIELLLKKDDEPKF